MLARTPADNRLLIPGLARFYEGAPEVGYLLLRVTIGYILFVHGWAKVTAMGAAGVTGFFTKVGLPMPGLFAYAAMFLETAGCIAVVIGLFTRFFAAALANELLIAMLMVHWANGFYVTVGKSGYEYVLFLGIVMFAIAIRGGGPYSVDRAIGKEL